MQGEKQVLRRGEKIVVNEKLIEDLFPKYTSSSYNSMTENNQPNQKVGKRPKQTFLQRRHIDG